MDDFTDSPENATVFIALETNCGHWKIEVKTLGRGKMVLISYHGLFRFTRMLLGMESSLKHFNELRTSFPLVGLQSVSTYVIVF